MIIVSQDRESIVNFDNITKICIMENAKKKYVIQYESINDSFEDLGEYETKERAREVLQKIVKKYSSYLQLSGGKAILQGQMDIQPNIFNIPKVYYMPEE